MLFGAGGDHRLQLQAVVEVLSRLRGERVLFQKEGQQPQAEGMAGLHLALPAAGGLWPLGDLLLAVAVKKLLPAAGAIWILKAAAFSDGQQLEVIPPAGGPNLVLLVAQLVQRAPQAQNIPDGFDAGEGGEGEVVELLAGAKADAVGDGQLQEELLRQLPAVFHLLLHKVAEGGGKPLLPLHRQEGRGGKEFPPGLFVASFFLALPHLPEGAHGRGAAEQLRLALRCLLPQPSGLRSGGLPPQGDDAGLRPWPAGTGGVQVGQGAGPPCAAAGVGPPCRFFGDALIPQPLIPLVLLPLRAVGATGAGAGGAAGVAQGLLVGVVDPLELLRLLLRVVLPGRPGVGPADGPQIPCGLQTQHSPNVHRPSSSQESGISGSKTPPS